MSRLPPIERFLGPLEDARDPASLLGIDPGRCDEDAVRAALSRRLERLEAHPEGRGPEADEVRLALHVAAAQMLDPGARGALASEPRGRGAAAGGARDAGAARPGGAPDASPEPFDRAVLLAIVASGGWNDEARRRIYALAHAHRIDAATLRSAITGAGAQARSLSPAPAAPARAADPALRRIEERARASRERARAIGFIRRWGALALLIMLAATSLLMLRAVLLLHAETVRRAQFDAEAFFADEDGESAGAAPDDGQAVRGPPGTLASSAAPPPAPMLEPGVSAPAPPVEPASAPTDAAKRWYERALALIAQPAAPGDAQRLERAAALAHASIAAEHIRRGDEQGAAGLLAEKPFSSRAGAGSAGIAASLTAPGGPGDGRLALDLLALRRRNGQGIEAYRDSRFDAPPLGPVDCDIVAESALFGSPLELRLLARSIAQAQRDNPAMIHAILEALPRASRQPPVAELISALTGVSLPPIDDPAWGVRARAALVGRLADLLGPSERPEVEAAAGALLRAYERAAEAADPSSTPGLGSGGLPDELAHGDEGPVDAARLSGAAAALWGLWHDRAAGGHGSPVIGRDASQTDQLARRREMRLALARGPLQRLIADRLSTVEAAALALRHERPAAAPSVRLVLDELSQRTRSAGHAFEQLLAVEEAMLRLWFIGLALPLPASEGSA